MNLQFGQTISLSSKSPLASPNHPKFPTYGKRHLVSPKTKIDKFGGVKQRKMGRSHQQPLKMLFNNDPLNLASISNRADGWQSPETSSPIVDRAHEYEPSNLLPIDVKDPLNLNSTSQDDLLLRPGGRKRRKRKRRNTYNSTTDNDNSSYDVSSVSLDCSNISSNQGNDSPLKDVKAESCVKPLTLHLNACPQDNTTELKSDSVKTEISLSPRVKDCALKSPNLKYRNRKHSRKSTSSTRSVSESDKRTFNIKKEKFKYGNHAHYYATTALKDDVRLNAFRKDWFDNKDCLDIGCNIGTITRWVVERFHTKSMVGLDIDSNLIKLAKKALLQKVSQHKPPRKFPYSFQLTYGPIVNAKDVLSQKEIKFIVENYVPSSDNILSYVKPSCYDVILCLSVTKWVQLNFGDDGLKRMFKKIYLQLRPHGRLLLEPQPLPSYKKKKNLTATTLKNFEAMKLMPTDFVSYLLSSEVGFVSSECLCYSKGKKGSDRPLYLLTKGSGTSNSFHKTITQSGTSNASHKTITQA